MRDFAWWWFRLVVWISVLAGGVLLLAWLLGLAQAYFGAVGVVVFLGLYVGAILAAGFTATDRALQVAE